MANSVMAVNGRPSSRLDSASPPTVGQAMLAATATACIAYATASSTRLSCARLMRVDRNAPSATPTPKIGQNRSGQIEPAGNTRRAITGRKVAVMM